MTISDRPDEFRIGITGRLSGKMVYDLRSIWENVLREKTTRKFTVDITELGGYDYIGLQLLREMYRHGTQIAARTAPSLLFLKEICAQVEASRVAAPQNGNPPSNRSKKKIIHY